MADSPHVDGRHLDRPDEDGPGVRRHVSVEGIRLRFAAAHMATIGGELEPLHGHNYEVRASVDGTLTADHWVIDFSALKRVMREECDRLDHRFLLQTRSTIVEASEGPEGWSLRHAGRRYVFPASDVAALPIANTTAELIAELVWRRAVESLTAGGYVATLLRLAVEVEEMPGQAGGYAADIPREHSR